MARNDITEVRAFRAEIRNLNWSEGTLLLDPLDDTGGTTVWKTPYLGRNVRRPCRGLVYRFRPSATETGRLYSWAPEMSTREALKKFLVYCDVVDSSVRLPKALTPAVFAADPVAALSELKGLEIAESAIDRAVHHLPAGFLALSGHLFNAGAGVKDIYDIYLALVDPDSPLKSHPKPAEFISWLNSHALELIEVESIQAGFRLFERLVKNPTPEKLIRGAIMSGLMRDERGRGDTVSVWGTTQSKAESLLGYPEGSLTSVIVKEAGIVAEDKVAEHVDSDHKGYLSKLNVGEWVNGNKPPTRIMRSVTSIRESKAARGLSQQHAKRAYLDSLLPDFDTTDGSVAEVFDRISRQTLTVVAGAAGSGKTWAVKKIGNAMSEAGLNVQWTATTGRAAQVLHPSGRTLHSFLGVLPGSMNHRCKVDGVDILVIDEASMLDNSLASPLGSYLQSDMAPERLVIVGDPYQLPPVGAGKILHDIMESSVLSDSVIELTTNRRIEGRGILDLATALRKHETLPELDGMGDVSVLDASRPSEALDKIVSIYTSSLVENSSDPTSGCMVVSLVYDGPLGVTALNKALRDAVLGVSDEEWLVGQKVIHTRNRRMDDDTIIANGTFGTVEAVDGSVTVVYESGVKAVWPATGAGLIASAYALTLHRAQGSQAGTVIVVAGAGSWKDPAKGYTAVTRAQKRLVIVGDPGLLSGEADAGVVSRRTGFQQRVLNYNRKAVK